MQNNEGEEHYMYIPKNYYLDSNGAVTHEPCSVHSSYALNSTGAT